MMFCQSHWSMLKEAVTVRGIFSLVARSGKEAAERAVEEARGKASDASYDPLMSCHWMISNRVLAALGPYLLTGDYCPVCEAMRVHPEPCPNGCTTADVEREFINGPADAALRHVKESPVLCALLGWDAPA